MSSSRAKERMKESPGHWPHLLPLPACHKGVYARRSLSSGRPKAGPVGRAMEKAGVRGRAAGLRLAESPPHPDPLPFGGEGEGPHLFTRSLARDGNNENR